MQVTPDTHRSIAVSYGVDWYATEESWVSCTHLQHEYLSVLLRQFDHNLVHLLARLGPWCPEVDKRDAIEVLGEQVLEVFRGGHFVKVGERSSGHISSILVVIELG